MRSIAYQLKSKGSISSAMVKILLVAFALCILLSFNSMGQIQTPESGKQPKLEGELKSIKDAGFTYDDLTYTSGNQDTDQRLKEIIEFVNNSPDVQMFTITM